MIELKGKAGRLDMTIEIKRAATGKTETVQLVGFLDPEDLEKFKQEQEQQRGEEG